MVGSPGQNGPIKFPVKLRTKISNNTGVPGQLVALVSITSTALGYKPDTPPQSTVIEFEPCPVCSIPPPPVIVQLYVDVGVLVTKYCSPIALAHTVSGLIVV